MAKRHTLPSGLFLLLLLAASLACSITEEKSLAEEAVTQFHARLDAGQFQQIYSDADEAFKKATTEKDAIALFDAVHRKLGPVKESRQQTFFVKYDVTMGKIIRLTYGTEFAEGKGTEEFVWRISDGRARLMGYNINSPTLVIK